MSDFVTEMVRYLFGLPTPEHVEAHAAEHTLEGDAAYWIFTDGGHLESRELFVRDGAVWLRAGAVERPLTEARDYGSWIAMGAEGHPVSVAEVA